MAREKRSCPRASEMQQNNSEKKGRVDGESAARDNRPITVTVDPEVLKCDVCFGPLTPPLYQCMRRGHITCSTCIAEMGQECQWCRAPEATMRCRVMEHFLAALAVPCSFNHKGRAAMVPYGERKAHEATFVHSPCYCPIRGCSSSPYSGASLLEHLEHDHPEIGRTCVDRATLSPLNMCHGEPARLVYLAGDDRDRAVFLLAVDRSDVPQRWSLWMVRLIKAEPADVVKEEEEADTGELRYKIMVATNGGVLSLVGETESVGRLTASSFLFVPGFVGQMLCCMQQKLPATFSGSVYMELEADTWMRREKPKHHRPLEWGGDMVEQNKRARANGEVKQEQREEEEVEEGEVSQEESQSTGPFPLLTVAAMEQTEEETQIDVRIAVALLHCHACLLPLKPPVFKCDEAHIVCSGCRCGHHGRAAVYTHCAELDAIVATAKVACAHAPYGCDSYVVYAAVTDHQRACPCAPCSCPDPGCDFRGSPAVLLGHFATAHPWPVTDVSYAKPCKLAVPLPRRCHVLVGEDDRAVFLVSPCGVGAGTAVCVVCVRANGGDAAAQYKCKLWVEVSSNHDNMVMMTSKVRNSDLSGGFPAAEQGMFLVVPPELLHEVSGETPILSIRIDRAAAAIAKSATPRARSQRRLQ
uniref:E3 ubiquitin-protein ligase n=1 Tax=Oryza punctata TaxID=4537 RepID=A0A0E0JDG7_ORYPU